MLQKFWKNYIKNQRSGSFRNNQDMAGGPPLGSQEGARRGPNLGRATCPPGCPGWPLDAPLRLYNPLGVETPKEDLFSLEAIPISAAIENKFRGDIIPVPAPCRDGEVTPDSSPSTLLSFSMKRE